MGTSRVVPSILWDENASKRKRLTNKHSQDLLDGKVIFITSGSTGSYYTLAKRNGKKAKTQKKIINGEEGILVRFEDD